MGNDDQGGRDLRIAALVGSAALLCFFVGYWTVQVQDVFELLELAYGPQWWKS